MATDHPSSSPSSGLAGLPALIWEIAGSYVGIMDRFASAGQYFLSTIYSGLRNGDASLLWNARDESFARWFKDVGHHFAAYEDTTSVPQLVARAHGVVLELGPGIGNQLARFDASRIAHVYGVESNPAFAAPLRDRLRAVGATNGLDAKYTPLICRIEDAAALARAGVVEGSVDCVVSMQVLCSLPDPRATARQLYRLLKPGGELLFWEHSSHSGFVTRRVQWFWSNMWQIVVGGCRLDVPIQEIILQAGEWEQIEVEVEEPKYSLMPRISGRLVKPGKVIS